MTVTDTPLFLEQLPSLILPILPFSWEKSELPSLPFGKRRFTNCYWGTVLGVLHSIEGLELMFSTVDFLLCRYSS